MYLYLSLKSQLLLIIKCIPILSKSKTMACKFFTITYRVKLQITRLQTSCHQPTCTRKINEEGLNTRETTVQWNMEWPANKCTNYATEVISHRSDEHITAVFEPVSTTEVCNGINKTQTSK